jgi:hypothetical protein
MVEARKPRSYKIGTLTAAKEDSDLLLSPWLLPGGFIYPAGSSLEGFGRASLILLISSELVCSFIDVILGTQFEERRKEGNESIRAIAAND